MSLNNSWLECCDNNFSLRSLYKNLENVQWTYEEIAFALIESIAAIFAILGNILVIIVFFRERKLRRKTNYYIISLASADFCVGILGIPFGTFWLSSGTPPLNNLFCLLPILTLFTLCNISVFGLLLISIDRILSINLPLNVATSSKNVAKEITLCWGIGIFIGFLPIFWHKESNVEECSIHDVITDGYLLFRFIFVILIPALTMGVIYFNIYKIIIRQINNEALLKKPPSSYGIIEQKRPEEIIRREFRATLNISLIVIIFLILWIPLHIVYILPIVCKSCYISRKVTALAISIAHTNSAINPLLYAYHMRDIRKAILNLLRLKGQNTITCTLTK